MFPWRDELIEGQKETGGSKEAIYVGGIVKSLVPEIQEMRLQVRLRLDTWMDLGIMDSELKWGSQQSEGTRWSDKR